MLFVPLQAQEYTRTSQLDAITIPQAPRLGSQVVEVSGLTKSYGDRLLIKDLSFSVPPGSVVGERLINPSLRGLGRLRAIQGLPSIRPHGVIEAPRGEDFSFLSEHVTTQCLIRSCFLRHAMRHDHCTFLSILGPKCMVLYST